MFCCRKNWSDSKEKRWLFAVLAAGHNFFSLFVWHFLFSTWVVPEVAWWPECLTILSNRVGYSFYWENISLQQAPFQCINFWTRSVPQRSTDALWTLLAMFGVPPTMLNIIRFFHEGMQAGVRVGSAVTNCFEVWNCLRQGYTMAPTLFNVYFNAVVVVRVERLECLFCINMVES